MKWSWFSWILILQFDYFADAILQPGVFNVVPEILTFSARDINRNLLSFDLLAKASNVFFQPTINPDESYDYIIVGAGPAGCVLANKLSEDASRRVLLIEAGRPESAVQEVPLAAPLTISSDYFNKLTTFHDNTVCQNMVDGICAYPLGQAIGGSSTVNYMVYTRGNKDDFDRWEEKGGKMWGYDESMKLFDEFERSSASGNPRGTLNVENPPYQSNFLQYFLDAGREIYGQDPIDFNGGNQMGMGVMQATIKKGKRESPASAYIFEAFKERKHRNLHIITLATVEKILIDEITKSATGVVVDYNDETRVIRASLEVILSAGPIRSAQLLMLSGIGPVDILGREGIPIIKELPVGHFMEHNLIQAPLFTTNTSGWSINLNSIGPSEMWQYLGGTGPLTSTVGLEAVAFHKTQASIRPKDCPDIELLFICAGVHSDNGIGFAKTIRLQPEIFESYYKPLQDSKVDTWQVNLINLHPRTTGRVDLSGDDYDDDPIIRYQFYEDPTDIEAFLDGIKIAMKYSQTEAMQKLGSKLYDRVLPGCEGEEFGTDDYWRCFIRRMATISVHATASNRMGESSDPESVVDNRLRVHGIRNLRVVDTSVVPMTVSGHTMSFAYLVGHRGAKIIIEDNKGLM